MQRSALCRSRRELSNAYLLAKIGVDTAENEPLEVWGGNSIQYSLHSLVDTRRASLRLSADAAASAGVTHFDAAVMEAIPADDLAACALGAVSFF